MNHIVKFGCFLLLFTLLSTCNKIDNDPSIIVNVDDEFYINLFEEINGTERTFQVTIKSIKDQECLNSTIDNNISISNQYNRIIMTLNGILEPDPCTEGMAPAFTIVPVADIKQEVYQFHINLTTAVKNEGRLTVGEDHYYLYMQSDDGIVILNNWLYKIPENTIWGYVGYEAEEDQEFAEAFAADLGTMAVNIEETSNYNQGYYGYFSIVQDNKIEFSEQPDYEAHHPFIYHFEGNNTDLQALVDSYCVDYPGLKIHLFDGRGNELSCD